MAIAESSILPGNLIAKHTSGTTIVPVAVTKLSDGTWQYRLQRSWQSSDSGRWDILLNPTLPVLDDRGNPVAAQKIGELTVDIIGLSQYLVVVPWGSLERLASLENRVSGLVSSTFIESANPPDDSPLWRSWLHRETINGKISLTYYIRSIADNAAIPIWRDAEYADAAAIAPSHANAVAISDTEFRQNLISGVSLIYAPKRDLNGQIGIRLFTNAATFTSVAANTLDVGGAMIAGWMRSLTDFTGESILITPPAQAVKIRLSFARPNNTTDIYEFPIS